MVVQVAIDVVKVLGAGKGGGGSAGLLYVKRSGALSGLVGCVGWNLGVRARRIG